MTTAIQQPPLAGRFSALQGLRARAPLILAILFGTTITASLCNLLLPEEHVFHVSTYTITLLGKYLCYALLALSVDVVWGYCGILSLGHGAFFSLGGYALGMYLMRQIGVGVGVGAASLGGTNAGASVRAGSGV